MGDSFCLFRKLRIFLAMNQVHIMTQNPLRDFYDSHQNISSFIMASLLLENMGNLTASSPILADNLALS